MVPTSAPFLLCLLPNTLATSGFIAFRPFKLLWPVVLQAMALKDLGACTADICCQLSNVSCFFLVFLKDAVELGDVCSLPHKSTNMPFSFVDQRLGSSLGDVSWWRAPRLGVARRKL